MLLVLVILPVTFSGIRAGTFIVAIATNKTCELNATENNSSETEDNTLQYQCIRLPHHWSCNTSGGRDLSIDAHYAIGKLLHWLEFIAFGFYAYKFFGKHKVCNKACSDVWKVLKDGGKASSWFWLIVVLLILPYSTIGVVVLPYFEIVGEYDAECEEKGSPWYHYVLIIHHWMGVPVHFYTVAERLAMMVACLAVYQVWHSDSPQSNEYDPILDQEQPQELHSLLRNCRDYSSQGELAPSLYDLYLRFRQREACLSTLDAHLQRYMDIGNRVVPILMIFKAWFIIQWFAFLATTLADLINVLELLILPINDVIEQKAEWYLYVLFRFLYDLLSFVIPYICGSLINKLHHDYYQGLRRNIRQRTLGLLVSMEKEDNFDFIPGIHEIGLDIPISNQGYSMSILLALIALVSSYIVANPRYWSTD